MRYAECLPANPMSAEGVGEGIGTSQDMHILAPPFSLRNREEYDDILGWSRISSYSGPPQNIIMFWGGPEYDDVLDLRDDSMPKCAPSRAGKPAPAFFPTDIRMTNPPDPREFARILLNSGGIITITILIHA